MALFLYLLEQPNYSGLNWEQYIQTIIQYNAQQIYKQVILNIQQQKELEIQNNEFQMILKRQNNQKLNIKDNKISGSVDMQMIGLDNLAKVEGIVESTRKTLGKTKEQMQQLLNKDNKIDIKVRFIAVEDDRTTLMCDSLDEQIFSINKINEFTRYHGNTAKELKQKKFIVKGLVLRN